MILHPEWYEYPLPALVYDAERGDAISAYEVFRYWAEMTKAGRPVFGPAAQFVACEMLKTLDGAQTPDQMIHKGKGKHPADPSWSHELVAWRGPESLDEACDRIGQHLNKSASTVKADYLKHRKRVKRVLKVQELLDAKAFDQLRELYGGT